VSKKFFSKVMTVLKGRKKAEKDMKKSGGNIHTA
jgi:hypothetical protein